MAEHITSRTHATIARWALVAVWALLPLTAGTLVADAVHAWPSGSRTAAVVLAWTAWAIGLAAAFVPRPVSLTTARAVAPGALVFAIAGATSTSGVAAALSIAQLAAATAVAWSPPFARAAVDALSYGTEERFPLRVPPALLFGPVEIAIALVAGVVPVGVLLIADRRYLFGVLVLLIGLPVTALAARSLHGLSTRVVVFVPAGVTFVDSFTLSAPVHVPRREIAALDEFRGPAPGQDADLRVGAARASVRMQLVDPTDALPIRSGRTGTGSVATNVMHFAPSARSQYLARAHAHRIGQRASAPPTSSSPT